MEAQTCSLLLLIPLFPLLGAAMNGLGGIWIERILGRRLVAGIGILMVAIPMLWAWILFFQLVARPHSQRMFLLAGWEFLSPVGAHFGLVLDTLSCTLTLVITSFATLIHIYSAGYMAKDASLSRFFSYLNLFVGMMLVLVLADNLIVMFIGWEGVGLASYLLIGFWVQDLNNTKAGLKAFVVNRIGDMGLVVGLAALFAALVHAQGIDRHMFPTFNIMELRAMLTLPHQAALVTSQQILGMPLAFFICICLFLGASAKSAQIPLFLWLPDAMAGPTPVSALIHAATMVTAGVYLLARLDFLMVLSPGAALIVASAGAATALMAAGLSLFQSDLKKVLAYSTISQLGFMFVGVGAGAYSQGIAHVITHACFKACLFLGAGAVIHACHHEQDMRRLGGLRKYLPTTRITYAIACFAIAGFPPAAGFWSKDAILLTTFAYSKTLWLLLLLSTLLTSLYIYKSYYLTFWGEYRGSSQVTSLHWTMKLPLWILAAAALTSGYILGFKPNSGELSTLDLWLGVAVQKQTLAQAKALETPLAALTTAVALLGFWLARILYKNPSPASVARLNSAPTGTVLALISDTFQNNTLRIAHTLAQFDRLVIDAAVTFVARMTRIVAYLHGASDKFLIDAAVDQVAFQVASAGRRVQRMENGQIQRYLIVSFIGIISGVLTFSYLEK